MKRLQMSADAAVEFPDILSRKNIPRPWRKCNIRAVKSYIKQEKRNLGPCWKDENIILLKVSSISNNIIMNDIIIIIIKKRGYQSTSEIYPSRTAEAGETSADFCG
jgi:hypothetical protein